MQTSNGWENIHFWCTIPLNTQTQAYRGRGREMFSMHMERCGSKIQGRPISGYLHWRQPKALGLNYHLTPDLRSARTGWRWTTANESKVCFCNHRSCKSSTKRCCTFPPSAQNQINTNKPTVIKTLRNIYTAHKCTDSTNGVSLGAGLGFPDQWGREFLGNLFENRHYSQKRHMFMC